MKNKKRLLLAAAALVLALTAGIYMNHLHQQTYLSIDGRSCRRDSVSLDLSGRPLEEPEKLRELKELKTLNLLDTDITTAQYEQIRSYLPECDIIWSVPFQGSFHASDKRSLTVTELTEEDAAMLRYFPRLTRLEASGCRNYPLLLKLEREGLEVSYTVALEGLELPNSATRVTVYDPDFSQVSRMLPLLPRLVEVELKGEPLTGDQLLALTAGYPGIDFSYEVEVLGVRTDRDAEFLDLSGIPMEDTAELERLLPLLPRLSQVDMVDCGIPNQEMEELNQRHPDVKFVWEVQVAGVRLRTDITHFMPVQLGVSTMYNYGDLKYCHEVRLLDFGHYGISNVDFIAYMPKLEYLLLHTCYIYDLDVIGKCTSLRFLEIMNTPVTDFWPLTNLVNLEDLNISYTHYQSLWHYGPFGDITPLMQMTWLDRLWMVNSGLNSAGRRMLRECLPNTLIVHTSKDEASTKEGWRHSLNYYKHRDLLDMPYFI